MSALRTLAGAAAAAVALTMSASAASACWGGCGYQTYVPPPVYRPACGCCGGCGGYQTYAPTFSYMPYVQPAYHVDQGPSYDVPPPTAAEPVPEEYGYPRRPWVGGYGYRRHFVGYRGYHGYGYRHGYHGYGHRMGPWRGYGPVRVRG